MRNSLMPFRIKTHVAIPSQSEGRDSRLRLVRCGCGQSRSPNSDFGKMFYAIVHQRERALGQKLTVEGEFSFV